MDDIEVQAVILHKLFRKRKVGAAHIPCDVIKRDIGAWLAKREKDGKRVDECIKILIREGIILPKPTNYGLEISLNPKRSEEIIARIREFYPEGPI